MRFAAATAKPVIITCERFTLLPDGFKKPGPAVAASPVFLRVLV
jgi:hypothetical protein